MNTGHLRRLGQYITNRRTSLGYRTRVAFAHAIDLSDRALGDVENGYREAGAGTYALIENGLGWRPGSIRAILGGGEPTPVDTTAAQTNSLSTVPIDDLLAEIRRRVVSEPVSATERLGPIGQIGDKPKARGGRRSG